jgi:hypothetical protein
MATAAVVAVRRRQGPSTPPASGGAAAAVDDDTLRRLIRVQATFRGARTRRQQQLLLLRPSCAAGGLAATDAHAGGDSGGGGGGGTMVMVPVRTAARVIRTCAERRRGNWILLCYALFLLAFAAMLLDVTSQKAAYLLKDSVKKRLGAVQTKDGRTYSECHTLEDIGYWIPAAAEALTAISEKQLGAMSSLNGAEMEALVAGNAVPAPAQVPPPPLASAIGGGDAAAAANHTGQAAADFNIVTGAQTLLRTAADGTIYLPAEGLVMQYNRAVPTLQVRAPADAEWIMIRTDDEMSRNVGGSQPLRRFLS